jgi:hypothetical protein
MTKDERLWKVSNKCSKHKHEAKTNTAGITWCANCGLLMNNSK